MVLADDHTLFRQGVRRVLEEQPGWQVVAEASDGAEAVRLTLEHEPHIAILDIAMPRLNGIEATRQIARRLPDVRVLIVSMYSDDVYITQGLQAGARGFILKDSADADLVRAVADLAAGKSHFSPAVTKVVLDDYVREIADLKRVETVLDLYCGAGPISLCLAPDAGHIWAIDDSELAIATAKQNARRNGRGNCRFSAGDVAVAAAAFPVFRVARVDPASVFRR